MRSSLIEFFSPLQNQTISRSLFYSRWVATCWNLVAYSQAKVACFSQSSCFFQFCSLSGLLKAFLRAPLNWLQQLTILLVLLLHLLGCPFSRYLRSISSNQAAISPFRQAVIAKTLLVQNRRVLCQNLRYSWACMRKVLRVPVFPLYRVGVGTLRGSFRLTIVGPQLALSSAFLIVKRLTCSASSSILVALPLEVDILLSSCSNLLEQEQLKCYSPLKAYQLRLCKVDVSRQVVARQSNKDLSRMNLG